VLRYLGRVFTQFWMRFCEDFLEERAISKRTFTEVSL